MAGLLAHVQALISGTEKHIPNGSFTIGNVAYTTASLVQVFQNLIAAITALDAAHVALKDAIAALKATKAAVVPIMAAYRRIVQGMYAGATQTLADFGIAPPKARKPRTSQENAAAAAKAKSTRKARGTTSRKQKLAVKGDVTGVIVTPVTDPSVAEPTQGTPPPAPPVQAAPPVLTKPTA